MNPDVPAFSPQVLLGPLSEMPEHQRMLVGFSGGADSTALLLALHQLAPRLQCRIEAVHFNHGLQAAAKGWEEHCERFCREREIPIQIHRLTVQPNPGSSPEALAREARYTVIRELLEAADIYLTAHQADDQAETVLLNLMRGSGDSGLAGIRPLRRFANGWLARPLLGTRRIQLEAWLESQKVRWIHDESNFDEALDRNFLRRRLIPLLDQRWPSVVQRLQQTAEHLRQRSAAFEELLSMVPQFSTAEGFTLRLESLRKVSTGLQAEIIRHWADASSAPPPPRARLDELLMQLQQAGAESHAEMRWRGWLLRHHAGLLWLHQLPGPPPCPQFDWGAGEVLDLGGPFGLIYWRGVTTNDRKRAMVCGRPAVHLNPEFGKSDRKKLKEIMRISGIPDWLRDCIPLLWLDGRLAAVGDCWLSPQFRKLLREEKAQYQWKAYDVLLRHVQSVCHNCAVDRGDTLV